MTLADLIVMVQDYLGTGTLPETGDRLTTSSVTRALNRGYVAAATEGQCFRRSAAINTTTDIAIYALPADFSYPEYVWYDDEETELAATDRIVLERTYADWRTEDSGDPTSWLRWDATHIRLYPAPDDGTGNHIDVEGIIVPIAGGDTTVDQVPEMSAITDSPAFPVAFHALPALWAVAYIAQYMLAGDPMAEQAGKAAAAEYKNLVRELRASQVNFEAFRA